MIKRLFSSHPRFRTLRFKPGMNIVLADRSPSATDRDTRNGAGKSSIIELIHFLLGADADQGTLFRESELASDVFGMDFELSGQAVTVRRIGGSPGRVFFDESVDTSSWLIQPDRTLDGASMRVETWNALLGHHMFGLRPSSEIDRAEKFGPTYRSLVSYFVRRARPGGFDEPHMFHRKQPLWQQQVSVAFLLGLDWTIPQAMERIRAKEKLRRQIRKMLEEEGAEDATDAFPSSTQLKTRLTLAENRASNLRTSLATFRVVDEYHLFEQEVDDITSTLATLSDENTFDRQTIAELEHAMTLEVPPDTGELDRVYAEAGAVLPDLVRRRFEDVYKFHESIIRNRRTYLEGELAAARQRIAQRDSRQRDLDQRRSKIMETLRTAGALESFTQMQEEYGRLQAGVEHLRVQHERAKQFEDTGREVAMERSLLEQRMAQNHREQSDQIERAVLLFAEISRQLYKEPGRLNISDSLTGPPVLIEIPRKASEAVSSMQIFCFDMTMLQLCREQERGPDFLVHDSHLFDGVDDRQIRHALELAAAMAAKQGFQYITTLNSDVGTLVESEGFRIADYVIEPRLSDLEGAGLFGRQFGDRLQKRSA